jgi:hypothetical protein
MLNWPRECFSKMVFPPPCPHSEVSRFGLRAPRLLRCYMMDLNMQNRIVRIDRIHSRAICTEIAERLRIVLAKEQSEVPISLKSQIDRLPELDVDSPSIVPLIATMVRFTQASSHPPAGTLSVVRCGSNDLGGGKVSRFLEQSDLVLESGTGHTRGG